nr:hypothetical protein [Lachnospiraceae bacterium]
RRRISGCEITSIDTSLISPAALGESISFNFNTKYEVDYRNTNKYIIKIYDKDTNEKVLSLNETKYTLGNLKWTPKHEGSYRIDASVYSPFSGETEPYSFDFDIVKDAGDEVTIYYKGFSEPYIHYALNGNWTDVPGVKMSKYQFVTYTHVANIKLNSAKELVCCFNDGNNNWDSDNGKNYTFKPGKYLYSDGEMLSLNGRAKLDEEKIVIYYNGYENPNIHYALRGQWTSVPGVPMEKSDIEGYAYKAEFDVTGDEILTCCFNDGNGNWDNNNYQDYSLTKGVYYINNGTVTKK